MKRIREVFFVKREEIKAKNKNVLLASFLAFIFGSLGFHRFYLGRKISAIIFAFLTILSLSQGEGIIFFILYVIGMIEGIIYFYYFFSSFCHKLCLLMKSFVKNLRKKYSQIKEILTEIRSSFKKKRKGSSVKKLENDSFEEIRTDDKIIKIFKSKPPFEEVKDDSVEFVDVSKVEPSPIQWEEDFKRSQSHLDKLEIPYERHTMQLSQIKTETLKMYSAFCDLVDEMLLEEGKSLDGEVRRIKNMNIYYDNLLFTLYCIAEGVVTESYSGRVYYDYHFSYRILEEHLGRKIKERIMEEAQVLREELPPAKEEIIEYFNLTESGLARVWWDEDGKLRENKDFSTEDMNILNMTESRNTLAWDYPLMREQIILLYLSLWQRILESIETETCWEKETAQAIRSLILGKTPYYELYPYKKIFSSLLKISENTVRNLIPNMRLLNVESEKSILEESLPSELLSLMNEHLDAFKRSVDQGTVQSMLLEMIEDRPEDWRLKLEFLLLLEASETIPYFVEYYSDKRSGDIAKEMLRRTDDSDKRLLSLSVLALKDDLSRKNRDELKRAIHSRNWREFEDLIQKSRGPSISFFEKILSMQKPLRRSIEIDFEKIEASKKELQETVAVVEEFIGVEDDELLHQEDEYINDPIIETGNDLQKDCLEYRDFLKLLLEKEHLSIATVKNIALNEGTLLYAFISDVNRELYDYVQDQTIIFEDNLIRIDEFYIDTVEELIENEE